MPERRGDGADWRILPLDHLPAAARQAAIALYWQAFRGKLWRLFGPDRRALALLGRVARTDHALVAVAGDGTVLGMAGFRDHQGGFALFDAAALRAVYGRWGGAWRGRLLDSLASSESGARLLVDGLAVAPDWRGRGIGADLVAALLAMAQDAGYAGLQLEVAGNNPRARALYQRLGFSIRREDRHWLLVPVLGVRATQVMRHDFAP